MSDKDLWLDENIQGDPREVFSPDGEYKLVITIHTTGKGTWVYSKAKLYHKVDGEWVLMQIIKRNYSVFWHTWVHHKNGKRYLFCGQNYQGYTCIDLEDNILRDYVPPEAKLGAGFCWAKVSPSPDGTLLAVDGCYWACPYEFHFYDFSDPGVWPLMEIGRLDFDGEIYGWEGDGFYASVNRLFRKSDDLDAERAFDMDVISEEEYDRLLDNADKDQSEAEYRQVDRHKWERGPLSKMYTQYQEHLERLMGYASEYPDKNKQFDANAYLPRLWAYWNKLSLEDRKDLRPPVDTF